MKLRVENNLTYLVEGKANLLKRWLKAFNKTAIYNNYYKSGLWDGFIHFFSKKDNSFPTGLLHLVVKQCKRFNIKLNINYNIADLESLPVKEDFLCGLKLYDYQLKAINTCLYKRSGGVEAATGSGKTAMIAGIVGALYIQHEIKSLILVSKVGLLHQTADDLKELLGDGIKVGMVGNGMRQVTADIVVATPQTLRFALPPESNKAPRKQEPLLLNMLRSCNCLILDEAHHASSETWYKIALECSARYRFAFSGTLKKNKYWEDLRLWSIVGKLIFKINGHSLWRRGLLAKPTVYYVTDSHIYGDIRVSHRDYIRVFKEGLVENIKYNNAIAYIAKRLIDLGKPPLILTTQIKHIKNISAALERHNVPFEVLYGKHSVGKRTSVKQDFTQGGNFAIIASTIWDEGENVPNISSIILAGGGKTAVALKQRLGRGMRKKEDNRVSIFDFSHTHCKLLGEHSKHRLSTYYSEKIEVRILDNIRTFSSYPI